MNIRTFAPARFDRAMHLLAFVHDSDAAVAEVEPRGENAGEGESPEPSEARPAETEHGLSPLGPNERDDDHEDR